VSHPLFRMGHMRDQLILIEGPAPDWRLDDRTRETGRRGVEAARQALRRVPSSWAPATSVVASGSEAAEAA
jgi:hypothetical protein